MRPEMEAPVLTAFCQRKRSRVRGAESSTDGSVLRVGGITVAEWTDPTRVRIHAEAAWRLPGWTTAVERFLAFWCLAKIVGVATY